MAPGARSSRGSRVPESRRRGVPGARCARSRSRRSRDRRELEALPDRSSLWAGLFDLQDTLLGSTVDDLRALGGLTLRISVVGSVNLDLVARGEPLAAAGETVTGATFARVPGGKGANQAVACARLGADVTLIGAVGDDAFAGGGGHWPS